MNPSRVDMNPITFFDECVEYTEQQAEAHYQILRQPATTRWWRGGPPPDKGRTFLMKGGPHDGVVLRVYATDWEGFELPEGRYVYDGGDLGYKGKAVSKLPTMRWE